MDILEKAELARDRSRSDPTTDSAFISSSSISVVWNTVESRETRGSSGRCGGWIAVC